MQPTQRRHVFLYDVGEEVVVALDDVVAYERGIWVTVARRLPGWTIARVTSVEAVGRATVYCLTFDYDGATYTCSVAETAIEGIA